MRFSASFSSTARGARLARLLVVEQLAAWGWAYDTELSRDAATLVGKLAANAALHGTSQGGRCFRLRMEANDARIQGGRGMLLVEAVAARWGVIVNCPDAKTVWCELELGSAV